MHRRLAASLLLAGCSCASPVSELELPVASSVVRQRDCPAGFTWAEDGTACDAVLPSGDCPAGRRPALGQTACVSVFVESCPAGLAPDPSGWGCTDVLPASPCAGAAREALGQTACQPLGDCSGPFPPAAATFQGGELSGHPVALHVQGGSALQVVAVPENPGPLDVLVSTTTRFVHDQTRLGVGEVPMPTGAPR